jgi:hypothetical protein
MLNRLKLVSSLHKYYVGSIWHICFIPVEEVIDAVGMVRGCVINDAEDDTTACARQGALESWIISVVRVAVPNNFIVLNTLAVLGE